MSTQSGETSVNAARVGGGGWSKGREMKTETVKTVSGGLKKCPFIIYSSEMQKPKEADTEHSQPSPPPSSPAHLHGKDCRLPVKAEAYRLRRAVRAPLSQFILPRVGEHVRAARTGEANGAYCCTAPPPHPPRYSQGFVAAQNTSV